MIYLATNRLNFKNYVGQTSKPLSARRAQHEKNSRSGRQSRFYSALRKYGPENFIWRVLIVESGDRKTSDAYEKFLIRALDTQNPLCGYNLSSGGEGMSNPSEETVRRMRLSHLGKPSRNRGRKFPEDVRRKMIERLRGSTGHLGHPHSIKAKEKMRAAKLGRILSSTHREKISQSVRVAAHSRELGRFLKSVAWG